MTEQTTTTTPYMRRPIHPGIFKVRLTLESPGEEPEKQLVAERHDLEGAEAMSYGEDLAAFISEASSDEFNRFWGILTTRRHSRSAGCTLDFDDAAIIDRLDPARYEDHFAARLLLDGYEKLLALAKEVGKDEQGADQIGAKLRALIDALPETLSEAAEPPAPPSTPRFRRDAPEGKMDQGLLRATFAGGDGQSPAVVAETNQLEQAAADSLAVELAEFIKGAADTDLMRLWWVLRTWRRVRTNGRVANFQEAAVLEIVSDFGYQGREAEEPLLEAFHKIADLAQQVAKDEDCYGGFGAKFREVVDTIPAKFEEPEIPEEQQLPSLRWDG
jgi:hypothetical protein